MSDSQVDVVNVVTGVGSTVTVAVTDSTARVVQCVDVVKNYKSEDMASFAVSSSKQSTSQKSY